MWGEIAGKEITNIEESYCLGEACLIFQYGKEAARTIAYQNSSELQKAQTFFKSGKRQFETAYDKNWVRIDNTMIGVVNQKHAERFIEVLENYKK